MREGKTLPIRMNNFTSIWYVNFLIQENIYGYKTYYICKHGFADLKKKKNKKQKKKLHRISFGNVGTVGSMLKLTKIRTRNLIECI